MCFCEAIISHDSLDGNEFACTCDKPKEKIFSLQNYPSTTEKMPENARFKKKIIDTTATFAVQLLQILRRCPVNLPHKEGIMYKFRQDFYADVRIEDRFESTVSMKNGNIEQLNESAEKKAFIRVFDGKMWYYTSTSDVENVQTALDELYLYATPNADIASHPIVAKYQVNKDSKIIFADKSVKNVPIEQKLALVKSTCEKLSSPLCNLTVGTYLDRYSVYNFYSSKGADITYDFQMTGERYGMALKCGEENFSNNLSHAKLRFDELGFSDEEIAAFIAEGEDFVQNAQTVVAGSYPVVFAPTVTGVFAHESFGHKSEADFMLGDENMAKEWVLGKKVGNELLTIRESGMHLGSGYVPYDDEGTKCTDTYLIKNGVLCGRLHSATTAAALDEELTGNARAINCNYEPIVRMTTTYVDKGESTPEELIADIKHGFYIKDYKHGSGMSTFTIAPNLAYEIVDGKIGKPVKIAVLTGNVFETLGLIDGVANDLTLVSFVGGGCGKMEQFPLNVAMGGPTIRISKMNVQ